MCALCRSGHLSMSASLSLSIYFIYYLFSPIMYQSRRLDRIRSAHCIVSARVLCVCFRVMSCTMIARVTFERSTVNSCGTTHRATQTITTGCKGPFSLLDYSVSSSTCSSQNAQKTMTICRPFAKTPRNRGGLVGVGGTGTVLKRKHSRTDSIGSESDRGED